MDTQLAVLKPNYLLETLEYPMPLTMEKRIGADNQQASLCELSWLGGIVDGEGCITVDKKAQECVAPMITIVNTELVLMEKVASVLMKHGIAFYRRDHPAKGNWKAKIEFVIAGFKRVRRFLEVVRPYLVSKAKKADLLQAFCNVRLAANRAPYSDRDKNLCHEIWALNGRGTNHWQDTQKPQRLYVGHEKFSRGDRV